VNAGHIYVIAFSNGLVKVGQTQNVAARFSTHEQTARSFGLKMTDQWESPLHAGWLENEQALKRLARELGGQPTTPEYFSGIDFDALAKKARELPFDVPGDADLACEAEVSHLEGTETMLREEITKAAGRVQCGWITEDEAADWLASLIYPDRGFSHRLLSRYARQRLRAGLKRVPVAA
jgi:predicted GIY-YIG superfamily endonuclease